MSTVVIQIKGQSLTDASIAYHFELEGHGTQDAHEPMGIFHDVAPGTYKLSAEFEGRKLEGSATVTPADEDAQRSNGMAVTVWL
jgi:hypothetical protein